MKQFCFIALAMGLSANVAFGQEAAARVPDHYIVQVRAGAQPAAVAGRHGVAPGFVYNRAINGFAGFVAPGRVAALAADPDVVSVLPDHIVMAIGKGDEANGKPTGGGSGGTTTPAPQVIPPGVQRVGPAGSYRGAGVGVAIIDTGIDFNHVDLQANLSSTSFNAFKAAPGQDDNGHGTHVAGTVAAADNTGDVVGVAPDAKLYAVKVLNARGSGSDSTVIAGLNWVLNTAVSPTIRVVNMSLGRAASADDSAMRTAIQNVVNAGIIVVVAAGNDSSKEIWQMVPAGFDNVLAVASTTAKVGVNAGAFNGGNVIPADTASYFTTDGAGVAVSAPGEDQEDISKSGFLKSIGILSTKLGGGTTRMSGSSMASPHVAGAVARLIGRLDNLSTDDVRTILKRRNSNPDAPLNPPPGISYSFDGVREGVLSAVNLDTEAPPTANSATVTMLEDAPESASVTLGSDPNGDLVSFTVNQPASGTVSPANGSNVTVATVTYTPSANFTGADSFGFTIDDGILSSAASVTINVIPVNDAPTLDPLNNIPILEDAGPQTVDLTGIWSGAINEIQTLTVTATSGNPDVIPDPIVSYTSPNATGSLTFSSVANASGTAAITVRVKDNGGIENGGIDEVVRTFTVTVTAVNDAPVAVNDSASTSAGTAVSGNVLANDTDVDGPTLSAELVTGPSNGSVVLNSDGSFTYTPSEGFSGSDTFTYSATDGALSSSATVTITVEAPPPPPA